VIDPITCTLTDTGVVLQTHIQSTAAHLASGLGCSDSSLFQGNIAGQATLTFNNGVCNVQAELTGKNCTYAGYSLGTDCTIAGTKVADTCHGTVSITSRTEEQCIGSWDYSCMTGSGSMHMHNTVGFTLPTTSVWHTAPHEAELDAVCTTTGITGTYRLQTEHKYKKQSALIQGTFCTNGHTGSFDGNCGTLRYGADFDLTAPFVVRSFTCGDGANEPVMMLKTVPSLLRGGQPKSATQIKGAVSIDFLHTLISALYEYDIQGTGTLLIDAQCGQTVRAALQLHKGTIRIDPLYTVITGMRAHLLYDQMAKRLTIVDLICLLHKGSITLKHAVVVHEGGDICQWYAPIIAKNCLVTGGHTLFAYISGQATASYTKGEKPQIIGSLFLEKSHIKENIFSDAFQKRLADISQTAILSSGNDILCDITVETLAPLKVDTPFLKADARMALHITNTLRDPQIAGELAVVSGSLLFPYRPLHITKGIITMAAQHMQDPLIELVAQNQVRNHAITMHVTGSLLQHHLMFESTPSLTEQQIIALLLAGSEKESLNIVMPTLIMTNLASLLFSSMRSESVVERCLKRLMQPFKDVHIIPRFSDQTSRGGLRGALDIEVNDRVRALIQRNFSLTEDTRFELEYQASDDISVRAIRDEHRDMGAEIEMKWKL
jgi:hypothetical protein